MFYDNKCLFKKAIPEPLFRYISNLYALFLSEKQQYQEILYGLNFEVWGDFPWL